MYTAYIKTRICPLTSGGGRLIRLACGIRLISSIDRYQKPVFILENSSGFYDKLNEDGTINDPYRIYFLSKHIEQMGLAIADGVEVLGYTMWGPIDMIKFRDLRDEQTVRIYLRRNQDDYGNGTLKRYRKDSFFWYQNVIRTNGAEL